MKKQIYLLTALLFSTPMLNGYKNYIINSSGKILRLRIRYGQGNGNGVFLPETHEALSEFFMMNPNDIIEINANNTEQGQTDPEWVGHFNPLKIRAADAKDNLSMDIDLENNKPTETKASNRPKMNALDIDFTKNNYNANAVFVLTIKPASQNDLRSIPFVFENIKANPEFYYNESDVIANMNIADLNTVLPKNKNITKTKNISYQDLIKKIKDHEKRLNDEKNKTTTTNQLDYKIPHPDEYKKSSSWRTSKTSKQ